METWRKIPSLGGLYEVSDLGAVRVGERLVVYRNGKRIIRKARNLRPIPAGDGYFAFNICCNGMTTRMYIHRAVCEAFNGPPRGATQVNHMDGDKENNAPANLEWCNKSQNMLHSCRVLGNCSGERHYAARLTADSVREIIRLHKAGHSDVDLATRYTVSRSNITQIRLGISWSSVTGILRKPRASSSCAPSLRQERG